MPMLPSMDRFSQGLPDPQDTKVVAYCDGCDGEIYEGEDVWLLRDGCIVHQEYSCLEKCMDIAIMTVEEALKP